MKSTYAYIRVSTQKQGLQGSSLQEQRAAIDAYALRNELQIVEWFEEAETAAKRGRPAFTRMMRALSKGRATAVVMHKIDRGARNFWDWAAIGDLAEKGVAVHFAHESLDLNSRGGRLAADIQAVVAADYIRNLRDEVRKGFYGRLKQGLYPLRTPVGYLDGGGGVPKPVDPVQGPIVRQAFELYATGDYNLSTLRKEMYCRGLRNRGGERVSKNGLSRLLNNPFYMGVIHVRRTGELFEGKHEPLVTKALYDRVQLVLRSSRLAGASWRHAFTFRHLIRCESCGRHLVAERQKGRYVYYRCHRAECGPVSLNEAIIDLHLRELFARLRFGKQDFVDLGDMVEDLRKSEHEERRSRVIAHTLSLSKLDERLSRLTDAYLDGTLEKSLFESKKAALLLEQRQIKDLAAEAASGPPLSERVDAMFELANTAYVQYENANPDEKRELVVRAISNFVGRGNEPVFEPKYALKVLLEAKEMQHRLPTSERPSNWAKEMFERFVAAVRAEMMEPAEFNTRTRP